MPRLATARTAPKSADFGDRGPEVVPPVPVMTGTHFHALDEKGRVIIPAKLRAALTERFWMIIDENDNIALYDYETGCDVLEYCERLMALYPEDEQIAAAVQRTTGAAELVTADTDTWRVAISDVLRCYAKLEKDVVTVGVLNKAVLSSRAYWEKTQEELLQNPKVKAQQAKILRAAASGQKLPVSLEEKVDQVGASGADGTGNERPAAASASDGGRGTRLLSLRELGR